MTNPVNDIIPREQVNEDIGNLLAAFSNGIDETVNFGSHILKWDVEINRGGEENLPVVFSFRHFLELIDSISILVKYSSIDPCKLILRGAMETYLGLEYIFEKDTLERSMGFLVWHAHKNLKLYKRLDPTSEQGKLLQSMINKDKLFDGLNLPNIPKLNNAIKNVESILNKPEYQKAEKQYEQLLNTKERNPSWYRLYNGPKNIQELASHLGLSALYEIVYRSWSGPTHGTDILQGKISRKSDKAGIIQIRYPKDAQLVTSYAMILTQLTFSTYIDNRVPNKKKDYLDWYITMRDFFQQVASKEQLIKIV
jgi:hypothetical protein